MPRKKPTPPRGISAGGSGNTEDFERLGVFYLGRPYDLFTKQRKPGWILYDSKDLVTHAVCVGMTGSGKTGLCLSLIEEAAIDNVPAIIIDPKGDLANLLLTFPGLTPEEFRPWINEEEASKKGISAAEYAAQQANLWKKGLASWHEDGARIKRFQDSSEAVIYTPGSSAGFPVSILKSFAAPPDDVRDDPELLREKVSTTVTGLLGLMGVEADPVQSREHILISTILDDRWRKKQDLDLEALIHAIQSPPVEKVGVLDLDAFFPSKDRFALAMKLNNLLAAPGFRSWLDGAALEVQQLLYTPGGKPRLAIFSIAHLGDAERMFFVTLLLTQVVGWMRAQPGTNSLRALLYMDEMFGFFPPVANPPSKLPLMTLLKQARAFGLGVVLATQNPVDLDYKGLANTGTWFIGRLQTERDKARVLEGLEGASASAGKKFDKARMEQTLAGLGSRIFLMNNVHEDEPVVFETRWSLSYLRGPLTRLQIKALMDPIKGQRSIVDSPSPETGSRLTDDPSPLTAPSTRPMLEPGVSQYAVPIRGNKPEDSRLVYVPMVLGAADVRFTDSRSGIDTIRDFQVLAPVSEGALALDWDRGMMASISLEDLERTPSDGARFLPVPSSAGKAKSYDAWRKEFGGWLYRTQKLELFKSAASNEVSRPGESEGDFRLRLQQAGRERRDQQIESLRRKYAPKVAALQERVRRADQQREKQEAESRSSQVQAAISVGASILGAFLGRKTISSANIGRATTAVRGAGRVLKESRDVSLAAENVSAIQQKLADLEAQFTSEREALTAASDPLQEKLEVVCLTPTKANITVQLVALAWAPHWQSTSNALTPAWT